jgi:CIC family chloride channel protein
MRAVRPSDAMPESTRLRDLLDRLPADPASGYPVVDASGGLVGLLTLDGIRRALVGAEGLADATVGQAALRAVEPLRETDDLARALRAFVENETETMPVVAEAEPRRVVGVLSRGDVLLAYDRELTRRRGEAAAGAGRPEPRGSRASER